MNRNSIDAIFENGVFRPSEPVDIPEGEHVSLVISSHSDNRQDLSDMNDLIDSEFIGSCQVRNEIAPSVEEIRRILRPITESLADRIASERDER